MCSKLLGHLLDFVFAWIFERGCKLLLLISEQLEDWFLTIFVFILFDLLLVIAAVSVDLLNAWVQALASTLYIPETLLVLSPSQSAVLCTGILGNVDQFPLFSVDVVDSGLGTVYTVIYALGLMRYPLVDDWVMGLPRLALSNVRKLLLSSAKVTDKLIY